VEDVELRSAVREDGARHFGASRVDDPVAERFGLALQLEWRSAFWANIVNSGGVS